ncbi:MAG: sugar phosphate isomerase/epimerase [Clostridia bacterium]|nr:sugar phosphate isomerase/epimerase [Clostridia bacterium]
MPKIVSFSPFFTDLHAQGIDYAAARAKEVGFDAVEFIAGSLDGHDLYDNPDASRFASVLTQNDLGVGCYSVCADFVYTEKTVENLLRNADFAVSLGAPYLHHTLAPYLTANPRVPEFETLFAQTVEAAVRVAEYCKTLGLTVLYEPQGIYFNGTARLQRFFAEVSAQCSNVGICADFGNPMFVGEAPAELIAHFAPFARHAHVKDYLHTPAYVGTELSEEFCLADGSWLTAIACGKGSVDVKGCLAALKAVGYNGAFALECNGSDEMLRQTIANVRDWWETL